jgi:hypothetical protein
MKTRLGFLTEEGRTRSKNAFRRFSAYAVVMFLIAGAGGYGIHRYWVSGNLTLLQRVYFKQYMKSTWRSSLFSSKSHYTTLERTVIDPHTKKELLLAVLENDVVPALDDAGRLQYDKRHYPILFLKGGIEHKDFHWAENTIPDVVAYNWFRRTIYDDQSIFDMWRPAWLGAIVIFIIGTIALTTLDMVAQRLYLKGEPIRGTRELSPKKYARERRREIGVALKSYNQGSEI